MEELIENFINNKYYEGKAEVSIITYDTSRLSVPYISKYYYYDKEPVNLCTVHSVNRRLSYDSLNVIHYNTPFTIIDVFCLVKKQDKCDFIHFLGLCEDYKTITPVDACQNEPIMIMDNLDGLVTTERNYVRGDYGSQPYLEYAVFLSGDNIITYSFINGKTTSHQITGKPLLNSLGCGNTFFTITEDNKLLQCDVRSDSVYYHEFFQAQEKITGIVQANPNMDDELRRWICIPAPNRYVFFDAYILDCEDGTQRVLGSSTKKKYISDKYSYIFYDASFVTLDYSTYKILSNYNKCGHFNRVKFDGTCVVPGYSFTAIDFEGKKHNLYVMNDNKPVTEDELLEIANQKKNNSSPVRRRVRKSSN